MRHSLIDILYAATIVSSQSTGAYNRDKEEHSSSGAVLDHFIGCRQHADTNNKPMHYDEYIALLTLACVRCRPGWTAI